MLSRLTILFTSTVISLNAVAQASAPHIIIRDGASPEYRQLVDGYVAGTNKNEFPNRLLEFAENGEPSAIETLLDMHKDNLQKKEECLRILLQANQDNLPAMLYLGTVLSNMRSPECLEWFARAEKAGRDIPDEDFWVNYAAALMRLTPEHNEATLRKAWQLLKDWPAATASDENIRILGNIYFDITQKAVKNKFTFLVCQLCMWDKETRQHNKVTKAIFNAILDTPYADILRQRHDILISVFEPGLAAREGRDLIDALLETITESKRLADEKQQQTKQVAENIVKGNVRAVLQRQDVKSIPSDAQYQRFFQGFNPAEPSAHHIIMWARLIVRLNRADLINYPDRDLALQDYIQILDNFTLEKFCIAALRETFMLDGEDAL